MPVEPTAKYRLQLHLSRLLHLFVPLVFSIPLSFRRTPQPLYLNLLGQGWVSYFSSTFHFLFFYVVDNSLHHVFSSVVVVVVYIVNHTVEQALQR